MKIKKALRRAGLFVLLWGMHQIPAQAQCTQPPNGRLDMVDIATIFVELNTQNYTTGSLLPYTYSYTFPASTAGTLNTYKTQITLKGTRGSRLRLTTGSSEAFGGNGNYMDVNYDFKGGDKVTFIMASPSRQVSISSGIATPSAFASGGGGACAVVLNDTTLLMVAAGGSGAAVYYSGGSPATRLIAGVDATTVLANAVPCTGSGCTGLGAALGGGGAGYLVNGGNATANSTNGGKFTSIITTASGGSTASAATSLAAGYSGWAGGGGGSEAGTAAAASPGGGGGYAGGNAGFVDATTSIPATAGTSYINTLVRNGVLGSTGVVANGSDFPYATMNYITCRVLPVNLLSFTGQAATNTNVLKWTTASELNSQAFMIEHTPDGSNWESLSTIAAAGTTSMQQSYTYSHHVPAPGDHYYRLKILNKDGSASYSSIIRLVTNNPGATIWFDEMANRLNVYSPASGKLNIYNSVGKKVSSSAVSGSYSTLLSYAPGIYLVELISGNGAREVHRILLR